MTSPVIRTPGEVLYSEFHIQFGIQRYKPWNKLSERQHTKWERMASEVLTQFRSDD